MGQNGGAIRERDVPDLNVLVAPFVEQLDAANFVGDFLGEDRVAGGALDFDFAVRHDCGCAERRLGEDGGRLGVCRRGSLEVREVAKLKMLVGCGRRTVRQATN